MIDQKEVFKQMIHFQKTALDNSLETMSRFQQQAEAMFENAIEQNTWLPDEGKKLIMEWNAAFQKGRDEFQKIMDENYKKVESFWSGQ